MRVYFSLGIHEIMEKLNQQEISTDLHVLWLNMSPEVMPNVNDTEP